MSEHHDWCALKDPDHEGHCEAVAENVVLHHEPRPGVHEDEYDVLARQLHESIAEGQSVALTAKALRILATPPRPTVEALLAAYVEVEAGYMIRPDRTSRAYWQRIVAALVPSMTRETATAGRTLTHLSTQEVP